jgi:hypothetical protein
MEGTVRRTLTQVHVTLKVRLAAGENARSRTVDTGERSC